MATDQEQLLDAALRAAKAATVSPDVVQLVDTTAEAAQDDLTTAVEIKPTRTFPAIADLPLEKNRDGKYVWRKLEDAAVVLTDLKSSTAVSYSKQDRIGARLYQASTGGCSRVLQDFAPDFVDIQGDGLFAIFCGDRNIERAMCAAVTLNSFGKRLRSMLKEQFGDDVPEMKDSGLKVGADRGILLVKKIGVRGDHNEPVWAGKPVNYAAKCAQAADAGSILVTSRFFKDFLDNQYVRYSCGCVNGAPGDGASPLWLKSTIDALGEDGNVRELESSWCKHCGTKFARAILKGEKDRGLNTGELKKWREPPAEAGASDGG